MEEERETGDRPAAESPRPADDTQRMPGPQPPPPPSPPDALPVEPPPDLSGETQRIPSPTLGSPAPWAHEPPRPAASALPPPLPDPGSGAGTVPFSGMPGIPSPYESPFPAPSPGPVPAPPPAPSSPYGPPPAMPPAGGYAPAYPPPPAAYAPPPVYGPAPPGSYGSYAPGALAPPVSSHAVGAMVCGILSIVFSCWTGPFGAILAGVALFLVHQHNQQRLRTAQAPPNPSDATYLQAGRITALIGLAIGVVYTVLLICYVAVVFIALASGAASGYP